MFDDASRRRQVGRVSVVTPATTDILTAAEAKAHLRVETSSDDALITELIKAATEELDPPRGWLGRSLITRTLRLTLDAFPPDVLYLPGPPVTSVSSVKYRDTNDVIQTLDVSLYLTDLIAEPALLWIGDDGWPDAIMGGPDTVRIDYVAGYANAAAIPHAIRQWLLIRIGDLYRDREGTVLNATPAIVGHVDHMLDNWRIRA